ncbi:MAG: hypothetical protein AAB470_00210 [Patescibacteria group bacterium]
MKIKTLFIVLFFLLSFVFVVHAAGNLYSISGWAWSSNIGWISAKASQPESGGGSYGLLLATKTNGTIGTFIGYTWSSNIGWISFNTGIDDCPTTDSWDSANAINGCIPSVDLISGKVTGWVQAMSGAGRTDGWDGWIQLAGTNHTSPNLAGTGGITYDKVAGKFKGYAWGDTNVGWINFDSGVVGVTPVTCNGCPGTTPNPTVDISANPTSVTSGGSSNISWTSTNATACDVTRAGSPWRTGTSGTNVSSGALTANTTFIATCTGAIGTTPASDTVTVNSVASLSLFIGRASDTPANVNKPTLPITQGDGFKLKWTNGSATPSDCLATVNNSASFTGFNNVAIQTDDIITVQGSETSALSGTYTLTISCLDTNPLNASVTLQVGSSVEVPF